MITNYFCFGYYLKKTLQLTSFQFHFLIQFHNEILHVVNMQLNVQFYKSGYLSDIHLEYSIRVFVENIIKIMDKNFHFKKYFFNYLSKGDQLVENNC